MLSQQRYIFKTEPGHRVLPFIMTMTSAILINMVYRVGADHSVFAKMRKYRMNGVEEQNRNLKMNTLLMARTSKGKTCNPS